jgi:hypothetical protein
MPESRPSSTLRVPGTPSLFLARHAADGGPKGLEQSVLPDAGSVGFTVAVGSSGDAVVAGEFSARLSLGVAPGPQTILTTRAGRALFIAKYARARSLAWAAQVDGVDHASDSGVCALPDGAVVVTGTVRKGAALGSAAGSIALEPGFFLAKLAP